MSRFINPDVPFFDNQDGDSVALGTAYFGKPGQDARTNPNVPFSDSALQIPLAATQNLNSAGKLAQTLFLQGDYSLIIDDAADVQVFEDLNYGGIAESGLIPSQVLDYAALKAITIAGLQDNDATIVRQREDELDGGGGIFHWDTSNLSAKVTADPQEGIYVAPTSDTSGASGAYVRQTDILGRYNVRWFGAKGDAVDDTVAIQAVIDQLTSTSGGLIIYFPNGEYVVTTLTIASKFGITMVGSDSAVFSLIQVKNKITCNNCGDFRIYGLKFAGDAFSFATHTVTSAPTAGNFCFDMVDNCAHWDISGSEFIGFDRAFRPDPAAPNTGSFVIDIHRNYFSFNNIDVEGGIVLHFSVSDNTFAESLVGNLKISLGAEIHYSGNRHENGINVMTGPNVFLINSGSQVQYSSIVNNTFHEFSGIQIDDSTGVNIDGNLSRLHNTVSTVAINITGASQNIIVGSGNILNGFDGASFAETGINISDTSTNIQIGTTKIFNFNTALKSTATDAVVQILGADLRGVNESVRVQSQSIADRFRVENCTLQGDIVSTGNTASWIERDNKILGGSFTNTDGFLKIYSDFLDFSSAVALIGTSAAGVGTYSNKFAYGQRVGKLFIGTIFLGWSAHTGTGNMEISGLPIATSGTSLRGQTTFNVHYSNVLVTAGKEMAAITNGGSTKILLFSEDPAGGGRAAIAMDTAGEIRVNFTYFFE